MSFNERGRGGLPAFSPAVRSSFAPLVLTTSGQPAEKAGSPPRPHSLNDTNQ
ncbi:MAG: hypothetical protein WKG07_00460 [Hymenobacter sp.]